jgi:hypothetical protein
MSDQETKEQAAREKQPYQTPVIVALGEIARAEGAPCTHGFDAFGPGDICGVGANAGGDCLAGYGPSAAGCSTGPVP